MLSLNICSLIMIFCGLIGFSSSRPSLLHWVLISEIIWIGFYVSLVYYSAALDSVNCSVWGLLIFCLATGESAVGLGLMLCNTALLGNFDGDKNITPNLWRNFSLSKV